MSNSSGIHILKFGGSVLKNKYGFERMLHIIRSYSEHKLIIVISAFSRSTSMLERAALYAEKGQQELALATAQSVIDDHIALSRELLESNDTAGALHHLVIEGAGKIRELLRGISITRELTARTRDLLLSFGEFFALHIVKHYLAEQQISLHLHDATSYLITDSNFGEAKPIEEPTRRRVESILKPSLEQNRVVLTQGYVGADIMNNTTTMGKESSNFTATFLGALCKADEVCIFTDVNGICKADPKIINEAESITEFSYEEALLAAHNGLKLLYPTMIEPVMEKKIPLRIKSAFDDSSVGTVITSNSNGETSLISVRHSIANNEPKNYRTEMSVITFINIAPEQVISIVRKYDNIKWDTTPFDMRVASSSNTQTIEIPSIKVNDFLQFSYNHIFH